MHRQGLPPDVTTSGAKSVQQLGCVHVLGPAPTRCVHCRHMHMHIACLIGVMKQYTMMSPSSSPCTQVTMSLCSLGLACNLTALLPDYQSCFMDLTDMCRLCQLCKGNGNGNDKGNGNGNGDSGGNHDGTGSKVVLQK